MSIPTTSPTLDVADANQNLSSDSKYKPPVTLIDSRNWLLNLGNLKEGELIILLTPLVTHISPGESDTFHIKNHSQGLTDTHSGFININESLKPDLRAWAVEPMDIKKGMLGIYNLWNNSIDSHFAIDRNTLSDILDRPGFSKHFLVRDPGSEQIVGFAATYLSHA
ncbi:hypothetical protein F5884DRAFT_758916 [Xylogone sp. PMI_703]|nr:hypothetical protein F5884DRAFT_758916 [Xylogone sp. PMI_703]